MPIAGWSVHRTAQARRIDADRHQRQAEPSPRDGGNERQRHDPTVEKRRRIARTVCQRLEAQAGDQQEILGGRQHRQESLVELAAGGSTGRWLDGVGGEKPRLQHEYWLEPMTWLFRGGWW